MAQLFHMPSVLDSLPENWCLLIKANRAHMMIMLREAGAGHDPFGGSEWSSTPAQVWENLAKVEQLPNLEGADLSGIDFKWADLDMADLKGANLSGANLSWASLQLTDLTGANLTGADLRWATLDGADLTGANLTGDRPQMDRPTGRRPAGRGPQRSHHRRDNPGRCRSDWRQPDGGQPALCPSVRHQAGRSHRAGTLAQEKPRPPDLQNAEGATKCL